MRRVLAILGALVLIAALPAAAAAKPPIRERDHLRDAFCPELPTPAGTLDFWGYDSDRGGVDAGLALWPGVPYEGEPSLTRDWDELPTVEFGAGTVYMEIPLLDLTTGSKAGSAIVDGTFTLTGTIDVDDRFRNGNSWDRYSAQGELYSMDGTVTVPGLGAIPLDPAQCGGSDQETSWFVTQPNANVGRFSSITGECDLANDDGDTGFVFADANESSLFINGSATDSDGTTVSFYGSGAVGPDGTSVIDVIEMDENGETGYIGSATITAVDTLEPYEYVLKDGAGFDRVSGTVVDIDGLLSTSVGDFSLDHCIAGNQDVKYVRTSSSGPKPGGKRPANDLPSGAITVKPGYRASVATKGAQRPSEADYECLIYPQQDGSEFVIPVEYTVWYKLQGTGAAVTVDTAGSDIDTVIAVYEGSAGGATVACLDDTPLEPLGRSLQAKVTFTAAAGTTYWIQIGGLNEDTDWRVFPSVPYGTLKVAIR